MVTAAINATAPLLRASCRRCLVPTNQIMQRFLASSPASGRAASAHHGLEMTPATKRNNRLVALACLAFAGSVYTYSIRKLKEEDLNDLEEDITVVNLHESGLKATKFKGLLEESQKKEKEVEEEEEEEEMERQRERGVVPGVAMIANEGGAEGDGGKEVRKAGWKKWVLFWQK